MDIRRQRRKEAINTSYLIDKFKGKYRLLVEYNREYDDLDTARISYFNDMKEWKSDENHREYLHFGIREVKLNK